MSAAALSIRDRTTRRAKLREAVLKRDRGVCALCGVDTQRLKRRLVELRQLSYGSKARTQAYRGLVERLGIKSIENLFDVDHRQPLCEGGADELHNARTLCNFGPRENPGCHSRVTRELAARRARRPRAK